MIRKTGTTGCADEKKPLPTNNDPPGQLGGLKNGGGESLDSTFARPSLGAQTFKLLPLVPASLYPLSHD